MRHLQSTAINSNKRKNSKDSIKQKQEKVITAVLSKHAVSHLRSEGDANFSTKTKKQSKTASCKCETEMEKVKKKKQSTEKTNNKDNL